MLEHNSTLTLLDVSGNQMKAEGAAALADLKTNKTLTLLDLSDNEIGGWKEYGTYGDFTATPEGSAALADGLKANQSVQHLNVSSNSLDQSSKDELTKHKPPQLTLNM